MGPGPEARVFPQGPVFQVVPGLPAGPGEVGNFIPAGDPDALSALRQAGFNRVSLGMQSADDGELRAIGRLQKGT